MKNKKWLTYTLGILLTLVVLAAVGGVGFRIGMMQNVSNITGRPVFGHNFDGGFQPSMQNDQQGPQGNWRQDDRSFRNDFRGNDRRGGFPFFSPIFGLIKLAALGALAWIGYTFIKKSGWRLTRVAQSQSATEMPVAPGASEAEESVSGDGEKKDEA